MSLSSSNYEPYNVSCGSKRNLKNKINYNECKYVRLTKLICQNFKISINSQKHRFYNVCVYIYIYIYIYRLLSTLKIKII